MNADDPKFTAHVLGEAEDLTPAERAEIEAFIASNPAAAAEAAETKALAARLRGELQGEAAPSLDEKQRAAVLQAMAEAGGKKKVVPMPRRTQFLATIAACLTVGVMAAALLAPGYFGRTKTKPLERQLAALPAKMKTRDAGQADKAPAPAPVPSEPSAEVPASPALALNDATRSAGAAPVSPVSPPAAGGKVEGERTLDQLSSNKKTSEERETLARLGEVTKAEKKSAVALQRSAPAPLLLAKDASNPPRSEKDLLKQIDSINAAIAQTTTAAPGGSAAPAASADAAVTAAPAPAPLPEPSQTKASENPLLLDLAKAVADPSRNFLGTRAPSVESPGAAGAVEIAPEAANGTMIGSGVASDAAEKAKQPTVIDALDSKFDQEANQAVFVGEVVVKDPEFNVWCDKLTAFMKHDDKSAKGAKVAAKAATPKAASAKAAPPRGGGLDHAIAVVTEEGHRVKIIQDKIDPDTGKMKHGVGFCDWAFYDAISGDIIMHGSPDVTQNSDRCVATAPSTIITLNRDGHMIAKGPHRTFVIDDSAPKPPDGALPATPQPGSSPSPAAGTPQ